MASLVARSREQPVTSRTRRHRRRTRRTLDTAYERTKHLCPPELVLRRSRVGAWDIQRGASALAARVRQETCLCRLRGLASALTLQRMPYRTLLKQHRRWSHGSAQGSPTIRAAIEPGRGRMERRHNPAVATTMATALNVFQTRVPAQEPSRRGSAEGQDYSGPNEGELRLEPDGTRSDLVCPGRTIRSFRADRSVQDGVCHEGVVTRDPGVGEHAIEELSSITHEGPTLGDLRLARRLAEDEERGWDRSFAEHQAVHGPAEPTARIGECAVPNDLEPRRLFDHRHQARTVIEPDYSWLPTPSALVRIFLP
jgi:hypothetical protein